MKMQKVRVKVLIGASGKYFAYGWKDAGDKDPDDTLYDAIEELHTKEYFLTAELPIPGSEPEEIQASVESKATHD